MSDSPLCSRRQTLGAFAVGLCTPLVRGASSPEPATTATVIVLRHAEKLPMTKTERNPGLAAAGKARAKTLARTLQAAGVTRVFATELKRTQETAKPIADALKLKVETYGARKTKDFVAKLAAMAGEVIVVVGHANTVPAIVKGLGGKLAGLDKWGFLRETEHDRVAIQVLSAAKKGDPMRAVQTLDLRIAP